MHHLPSDFDGGARGAAWRRVEPRGAACLLTQSSKNFESNVFFKKMMFFFRSHRAFSIFERALRWQSHAAESPSGIGAALRWLGLGFNPRSVAFGASSAENAWKRCPSWESNRCAAESINLAACTVTACTTMRKNDRGGALERKLGFYKQV